MKLNQLFKVLFLFLGLVMFESTGLAIREGNGVAGERLNGHLMTFYSSGKIPVRYNPETGMSDGKKSVQGLDELLTFIKQSQILDDAQKGEILNSLLPTEKRKYYDVDENWLGTEDASRILNEYRQLKKVGDEFALYALTDTFTDTTYLLPAFYQLTKITEQGAALFHEGDWVRRPKATYESVYNLEAAFQAYYEDPTNDDKVINFAITYGMDPIQLLNFGYDRDESQGFIKDGYLVDGSSQAPLTFSNLVGGDWLNCYEKSNNTSACNSFLIIRAQTFQSVYDHSSFAKIFLRGALANQFSVSVYMTTNCERNEIYNTPLSFMDKKFWAGESYTYFHYTLGEPIWWLTNTDSCFVQFSTKK